MNQGLMNWLNAENDEENKSNSFKGTGLLLAPINVTQQDNNNPDTEQLPSDIHNASDDVQDQQEIQELTQTSQAVNDIQEPQQTSYEDILFAENLQEPDEVYEPAQSEITLPEDDIAYIAEEPESQQLDDISSITQELQELQQAVKSLNPPDTTEEPEPQPEPDESDHSWQEASTGFELSLHEPPPEIWTHINNPVSTTSNDDEEEEYEQGMSLQGQAYIPKHGKNFTQRLQRTLKNRKDRMEAEKEREAELHPHHPYIFRAFMMCGTMLIALGLAWGALLYLQSFTPENMNERAAALYNEGKYDEAMNLYQKAYKLYPDAIIFLAGIADSAERSGHLQTAEAARDEYRRALNISNDIKQEGDKEPVPEEPKTQSKDSKPEENITTPKPEPRIQSLIMSFDELLNEGNKAFNIGMYNRAVIYFFRAMELKSNDIRPYIGLAGAYRAKGLYFDAKRILDEARKIFRRNPTLEVEMNYLKGEQN